MTVLFPVLLSIWSLNLASGREPGPEARPLETSTPTPGLPPHTFRHLETNTSSSCEVLHCKFCQLSNKSCKICLSGYKLNDGSCVSTMRNSSSSSSLSLVPLICLIIGLIIFSVIFCGVCIFLARKRKPKYSGHRHNEGEITKSVSMVNDFFSDEVHSPSTLLQSPDNQNSILPPNSDAIRMRLLRHIYKSLPTLPKSFENTGECSICFELLTYSDLKLLKCEHLFHIKCCREWMKTGKGDCPTCGVEIN